MSPSDGLVFSYILKEDGSRPVGWQEIRTWNPAQGILWMHLDCKDPNARKWLFAESGLDEVSCEALIAQETRPRIVSSANTLLLILRGINCNPGAEPEDMVAIRMWFDEHRVITMRQRRVMAIEDVNRSIGENAGPDSPGNFLVMIAGRLSDRMGDVINGIDDSVDELEDLVLTGESTELRPKLADLRRQTIRLRRYISPQRDVLTRLHSEKITWLSEVDRVHIREIAERTARFVDDIDAARDRAAITQEELNNRLSEQMNKTMYILSIVAAIFLPLGLLTGLLGINVGGIPGTENRFAFAFVTVFLIGLAVFQYFLFKRKKWL